MKFILQTFVLISTFILYSCEETSQNQTQEDEEIITSSIATELVYKGQLGGGGTEGIQKQETHVTNTEDWEALLEKMDSVNSVSENFSNTPIDFTTHTIVAVFDEVRNSGGYDVSITMESTTENQVARICYSAPGSDEIVTLAITQPFCIVKIPISETALIFNECMGI